MGLSWYDAGTSKKVYVSTVLFANDSKVLHDRINIEKIEPLTDVSVNSNSV